MHVDIKYDVYNNCWGNNNSDPDLKINYGTLIYDPIWCPSDGIVQGGPDEDMYRAGLVADRIGNYPEALNLFELLVETYP